MVTYACDNEQELCGGLQTVRVCIQQAGDPPTTVITSLVYNIIHSHFVKDGVQIVRRLRV